MGCYYLSVLFALLFVLVDLMVAFLFFRFHIDLASPELNAFYLNTSESFLGQQPNAYLKLEIDPRPLYVLRLS